MLQTALHNNLIKCGVNRETFKNIYKLLYKREADNKFNSWTLDADKMPKEVNLGRSMNCYFTIQEDFISRRHFSISFYKNKFFVRNLTLQSDKVKLDGEPLLPGEPYEWQVGDILDIPEYYFELKKIEDISEDKENENFSTPVKQFSKKKKRLSYLTPTISSMNKVRSRRSSIGTTLLLDEWEKLQKKIKDESKNKVEKEPVEVRLARMKEEEERILKEKKAMRTKLRTPIRKEIRKGLKLKETRKKVLMTPLKKEIEVSTELTLNCLKKKVLNTPLKKEIENKDVNELKCSKQKVLSKPLKIDIEKFGLDNLNQLKKKALSTPLKENIKSFDINSLRNSQVQEKIDSPAVIDDILEENEQLHPKSLIPEVSEEIHCTPDPAPNSPPRRRSARIQSKKQTTEKKETKKKPRIVSKTPVRRSRRLAKKR
eukprot:snap_masked-scaffold_21-processed-gene-5.53-mRNA-1 protein AED:1.00 eAED:1.00 QI:0/-1/0/0/-1/1/1/0/427